MAQSDLLLFTSACPLLINIATVALAFAKAAPAGYQVGTTAINVTTGIISVITLTYCN